MCFKSGLIIKCIPFAAALTRLCTQRHVYIYAIQLCYTSMLYIHLCYTYIYAIHLCMCGKCFPILTVYGRETLFRCFKKVHSSEKQIFFATRAKAYTQSLVKVFFLPVFSNEFYFIKVDGP